MASQSMAAHIMKPVVSISMSPDSCSSGERVAAVALEGVPERLLSDSSLGESWGIARQCGLCSYCGGLRTDYARKRLEFRIPESEQPHVDGRPRRLHLVRRQARAPAPGPRGEER